MHGGFRQKDCTANDDVIHLRMIFSNPVLFPKPLETNALPGLIDVLPTLMGVAEFKAGPRGICKAAAWLPFPASERFNPGAHPVHYDEQLFTNQVSAV